MDKTRNEISNKTSPSVMRYGLMAIILITLSFLFPIQKNAEAKASKDFVIENNVLVRYTGDEEVVTIPDGVQKIADEVFKYCDMTKVIIPNSVKEIGEAAFEDCIYLTEIKFGTSVTTIGAEAFKDCSKLESVSSKIP